METLIPGLTPGLISIAATDASSDYQGFRNRSNRIGYRAFSTDCYLGSVYSMHRYEDKLKVAVQTNGHFGVGNFLDRFNASGSAVPY
jgi:hypothetical protein